MDGNSLIIDKLINISISTLPKMFKYNEKLFCYKMEKFKENLNTVGLSERYSLITILGLKKSKNNITGIPIDNVVCCILNNIDKINSIGDIGLLMWLCGEYFPDLSRTIMTYVNNNSKIWRYKDYIRGYTTEMSWLLIGSAKMAIYNNDSNLRNISQAAYRNIIKNYKGKGIFGHEYSNTPSGYIRGEIGCFADQVYPILALINHYKIFGELESKNIAIECADTICLSQGKYGQWWWHYDSSTGKVLGRYPVYSVHQYGMAPMALLELQEITKKNYNEYIYKGIDWLLGNNEISETLIDESNNMIWRCLTVPIYDRIMEVAKNKKVNLNELDSFVCNKYKIMYESRPYCFGWMLYALCNFK